MYHHNLFSSESVCAGHPDKLCDRISDAVLDAVLAQDPYGRTAIETLATAGKVIVCGEVHTSARVNFEEIVRGEVKALGYIHPELQFTHDTCVVEVLVHEQSSEIAQGVENTKAKQKIAGAGDQGMMFGFACGETTELMPLPIMMAHAITQGIDGARESGALPYLYPDGKCQVTVRYEKHRPVAVETLVLAVPHRKNISQTDLFADLYKVVIQPVAERFQVAIPKLAIILNGTGVWHFSGPAADTGLTGRKIVVDGYGGYARVGGGAFSGKDPSKVDRSGAYAARFLAKNIVAAGMAERAEVSLAYCIGQPQPVMQNVECFGSEIARLKDIEIYTTELLDCSVEGIVTGLDLRKPQYTQTAAYGHFGRSGVGWEQVV